MLILSMKLGGEAAADFLCLLALWKCGWSEPSPGRCQRWSQGLIPQPHFIQSISEGYLSPLLLNFYPHTSEPRTVFTPRLLRAWEGLPQNWKKGSLEHQCSWLKEPVLGRKAKWMEVQLSQEEIPAYCDSTVGAKPEFASQITGPCVPLAHSSQPSCSKAVTHVASIAQ